MYPRAFEPRRLELELPLDVAAVADARRRVGVFLRSDGLNDDVVFSTLLAVQEAAENAVRFSRSERGLRVVVCRGDAQVCATVRDYGVGIDPALARPERPDALAESGRGLFLIRALMDEVQVVTGDGTEIRMRKAASRAGLREAA